MEEDFFNVSRPKQNFLLCLSLQLLLQTLEVCSPEQRVICTAVNNLRTNLKCIVLCQVLIISESLVLGQGNHTKMGPVSKLTGCIKTSRARFMCSEIPLYPHDTPCPGSLDECICCGSDRACPCSARHPDMNMASSQRDRIEEVTLRAWNLSFRKKLYYSFLKKYLFYVNSGNKQLHSRKNF